MNQYENRYQPKWHQTFLFIFFCVCAIYAVLVSNPYLYSAKTYSEGLSGEKVNANFPVPMNVNKAAVKDIVLPEPPKYLNWSRSSVENSGETRDRRYTQSEIHDLSLPEGSEPKSWVWLSNELIEIDKNGMVHGFDLEGKKLWSFETKESANSAFLPNPISDGNIIYFVHSDGRIIAFNCEEKRILWSSRRDVKYLSDGFIYKNNLLVLANVGKKTSGKKSDRHEYKILKYNRTNGKFLGSSDALDSKALAELSLSVENQLLYFSSEERILAIQLDNLELKWQKVLSSEIEGPAVIATKDVLVSLKEGKVKAFNLVSGKDSWEIDLESSLQGQPTYVPIYNRVVAITKNGYLHVINASEGQRIWRFKLDNQNDLKVPWTARLTGRFIEELSMKWKYKGWTIWSPCVKNRICIYNPDQGQIVGRVMLSGNLITQPLFGEKSFKVVLRSEEGKYQLANYTEKTASMKFKPKRAPEPEEVGLEP